MGHIDLKMSDGVSSTDAASSAGAAAETNKKIYEVLSESGLLKNGKQINKGEQVELDPKTAANFITAGDIKEVSNEK